MLRIGELAALTGVTTKTIRHYHRIGLLPEAVRTPNGYRSYGLEDAVRLLRARRLAKLGLSLDDVADALTDSGEGDLRDILIELDAELDAEEKRLRERRAVIAQLLHHDGDLNVPAELASVSAQLGRLFDGDAPAQRREQLALELLGPLSGHPGAVAGTYQQVLADDELSRVLAELSRRFEALADVAEDDPAVDALVADGAGVGVAVSALVPPEIRDAPGGPAAEDTLFRALSDDLSPAQSRCMSMLFDVWRKQSS